MLKVILDTNILVSSLLASGPPAVIADLVAENKIIPFYTDLILKEYWDVLLRDKFGFSLLQVTHLIDDIVRAGFAVKNYSPSCFKLSDEDDRVFYDASVHSNAYLITGNVKHYPQKPFIVTPAQFLRIYQKV